nr:MAG TPA: protein of unknown function DUF4719 [Bacteriophage sp.]
MARLFSMYMAGLLLFLFSYFIRKILLLHQKTE